MLILSRKWAIRRLRHESQSPCVLIDGQINGDTAGMGDIQLATKFVLLTGERLKITQYLDTYFPTGAAGKGLGTGHFSLEPGLLGQLSMVRRDVSPRRSQVPDSVAAKSRGGWNDAHLGIWGQSSCLYDGDVFAVIPTAELVCYTIFNASETVALPVPTIQEVDNSVIPTLHFGVRVVSDRFRDIGTVEFGLSGGINLGSSGWYEDLLRAEIRVMY